MAYEKAQIKDAPHADAEEQLSAEDEDRLYRHYGVSYSEPRSGEGREPAARGGSTDDAMTRSEEELDINTSKRTAGRARLRKFVDTDNVSETVSVQHETANVTREPITDANRDKAIEREAGALAGEDLSLGPTPQTRHATGGRDDVRDTTQGPTPEIRRATRLSKAAGGEAAGEPASDRASRSPGGGTQDRDATPSDTERQVLAPDSEAELIRVDDPDPRLGHTDADGPPPTTKER